MCICFVATKNISRRGCVHFRKQYLDCPAPYSGLSGSEEEEPVCSLDLGKILPESDAPYLTPRGKPGPNHPWNIVAVAAKVARLRG